MIFNIRVTSSKFPVDTVVQVDAKSVVTAMQHAARDQVARTIEDIIRQGKYSSPEMEMSVWEIMDSFSTAEVAK